MMRTGVFFHYQQGERLRDFPGALEGILGRENVFFYDAFYPSKPPSSFDIEPLPLELLDRVHAREMIEEVKRTGNFEGALLSATGTTRAAEKIWTGEIDNAFVFTGYGDHHAGTHFFGGGCYLNGAAIAIRDLRNRGARRFAILDTDVHHGDGTWEIFGEDREVLYVCLCSGPGMEKDNKVDIEVPRKVTDESYIRLVRKGFFERAKAFQPEILFWNWGYDGTKGDYGDIGLTPDGQVLLAEEICAAADDLSGGKLIVVLCGGSRRDYACYMIPRIIQILAGRQKVSGFHYRKERILESDC